jgi:hypothetical protein
MPTPETDAFKLDANWSPTEWFKFARRLERERDEARASVERSRLIIASMADDNSWLESERDELRQVIRDVDKAFPDLAEFQDKDGRSLKWLADKIQNAKGAA